MDAPRHPKLSADWHLGARGSGAALKVGAGNAPLKVGVGNAALKVGAGNAALKVGARNDVLEGVAEIRLQLILSSYSI